MGFHHKYIADIRSKVLIEAKFHCTRTPKTQIFTKTKAQLDQNFTHISKEE